LRRTFDFFGPSKPASVEKVKAWMGGEEAKAPAVTHGEAGELAFDLDDERRGGLTTPTTIWTIRHGFPRYRSARQRS
jgi:hypothetical protein